MTLSSSIRRLAALLGLSALCLVLLCTPALAHSRLVQSDPASGANLSNPPKQVRLQFNEHVEAEFTPVKVLDGQGNRVDQDDGRVDPGDQRVVVDDLKDLPVGSYTIEWRVISADTHPVNGSYEFSVSGTGKDGSQSGSGGVAGSDEQPSDQAQGGSDGQEDTGGIYPHILHIAGLGLGAVILVVLALLQRARGKRSP